MNVKTKEEFEQDHLNLIAKYGLRDTVALIHKAHSSWVLADLPMMENSESEWTRNMGKTLRNRLETDVEFLERHIETLESILFAQEMSEAYWK